MTISGVGSSADPYVIASSGGGGGGAVVTTTIAALNTAATGAGLVVGTTYIVTDWTNGVLSGPNLLVLDALDASTPSPFVQVKTPLGQLGPSDGEFLWDAPGPVSDMARLRDGLGNDVSGTSTIGQWPWGNTSFVGNTVHDATFTNLASATSIQDCVISDGCVLDFTGATVAVLAGSVLERAAVTAVRIAVAESVFLGGSITQTGGTLVLQQVAIQNGSITGSSGVCAVSGGRLGHGASLSVGTGAGTTSTLTEVDLGDNFVLSLATTGTAPIGIDNTVLDAQAGGGLTLQGAGVTYAFAQCEFSASTAVVTIDGAGGTVAATRSRLVTPTWTRDAAATAGVSITASDLVGVTVTQGAGAGTGALSVDGCDLRACSLIQNGAGALTVARSRITGTTSLTVAAAGLLSVTDSVLSGAGSFDAAGAGSILVIESTVSGLPVVTAAAGDLHIQTCDFSGATAVSMIGSEPLTIQSCAGVSGTWGNNMAGASGTQVVSGCRVDDSSLTFVGTAKGRHVTGCVVTGGSSIVVNESAGSTAGVDAVTDVTADGHSSLQVDPLGSLVYGRLAADATLNTAAFAHTSVIIDGAFTVTLTAANTNTLKNSLGSNVV